MYVRTCTYMGDLYTPHYVAKGVDGVLIKGASSFQE